MDIVERDHRHHGRGLVLARHIRRMRMLYMERRACLIGEIERQLGPRLQIVSAEAGCIWWGC